MVIKDRTYLWILIIFTIITICAGQNWWKMTDFRNVPRETSIELIWCTINNAEQHKCENFAKATERDRISVGNDVFKIKCKQAFNKDECITLIDDGKATLTTLDAGEVFVGARYHSLVPIAQEVYEGGFKYYYSVAVVKKGTVTDINSLYDFRNRKVCFAGVETFAGWILPIYTLMKEGGMDIVDCNNHVKTAIEYFGPSCAVNCLTDKYNPIGDNSDKLCQLCVGKVPGGRCTDADPYADYDGAFRCLLEAGEIAFLKHNTVAQLTSGQEFVGVSKDGFELLCKDGTRRSVDDYLSCHWGSVPSDAVVTSSAVRFEDRKKYQKFLEKAANRYASVSNNFTSLNDNRNTFDVKPEFDQYGNKINRFKRQNFGNFDQYKRYNDQPGQTGDQYNRNNLDQYNRNNDDPYNRNNQNNEFPKTHDPNNQFSRTNDPNSRTSNQFGQLNDPNRQSNQPDLYNQNYDQYGHNIDQSNQHEQDNNNNNNQNSQNNPFYRDPYSINRDQFGINIDPYDRDPNTYNQGQDTPDVNYNPVNTNDGRNRSNITYFEVFNLFESTPLYGTHPNLIFQDATRNIAPVSENQQTYSGFLERSLDVIMGIRDCPVGRMSLCVTSDPEMEKCIKMKVAMKAQLLKPDMDCYKGHSQIHCMQAIRSGSADVVILDASDVYTAGFTYELVPFISEVYNLIEPEYYVVAVAKESDPNTELTYLRGKYTCHGGINTAAGWVYPLAFLISNGWIRSYGCNSIRAAAEYFTKSCVPGALSTEYNTGVPYDNMCDLCHGASYRYCRRDASEDYYGHTGAFRCLVEGGGHVAFVKHTTVTENTGGKKREWWTRDNLNDDYELLCTDGTRKEINDYEKCNLGKVKANAIVTRGGYGYNTTQINAYTNLFLYAQTFYGKKTTDEFSFSMFSSAPPYSDLIFQDATTQLKIIDPDNRHFSAYLGSDFMRARRITDCHAGSSSVTFSLITLILSAIFALVVVRS